jgi:protein-disulfide isomerase
VRIVFRHYPLSSACNSKVGTEFHYFSCEAAQAAEAARQVGTPEQVLNYYRLLYANAARLDERPYEKLAAGAGLDAARFAAALRNDAGRDRLREDIALGERLAIDGTPALFLDGRRLRNWRITSGDTEVKVDQEKTLALWERLLGERAIRTASSAAAEDPTTEPAPGPTE